MYLTKAEENKISNNQGGKYGLFFVSFHTSSWKKDKLTTYRNLCPCSIVLTLDGEADVTVMSEGVSSVTFIKQPASYCCDLIIRN